MPCWQKPDHTITILASSAADWSDNLPNQQNISYILHLTTEYLNSITWMTANILMNYLEAVNAKMGAKNEKSTVVCS